jgi:hypothetical protein
MNDITFLTGLLGIKGEPRIFVKNSQTALDPRLLVDSQTLGNASGDALRMYPIKDAPAETLGYTGLSGPIRFD